MQHAPSSCVCSIASNGYTVAPRCGDKWHLDEMCLVMNSKKYGLWRAVDQDGYELDILLQSRKNKKAAKRFFKKLLKGDNITSCKPFAIIANGLP